MLRQIVLPSIRAPAASRPQNARIIMSLPSHHSSRSISSSITTHGPNPPTPPASSDPAAARAKAASSSTSQDKQEASASEQKNTKADESVEERPLKSKAEEEQGTYGTGETTDKPAEPK